MTSKMIAKLMVFGALFLLTSPAFADYFVFEREITELQSRVYDPKEILPRVFQ